MAERFIMPIRIEPAQNHESSDIQSEPLDFAMERIVRNGWGKYKAPEGAPTSDSNGVSYVRCSDGIWRPVDKVFLPAPDAGYLQSATQRFFDKSIDRILDQVSADQSADSLVRSARQLITITGAGVNGLEIVQMVNNYAKGSRQNSAGMREELMQALDVFSARRKAAEIIAVVVPGPVEDIGSVREIEEALRRINTLFPIDRSKPVSHQHPLAQSLRNALNSQKSRLISEVNQSRTPGKKSKKRDKEAQKQKKSIAENAARVKKTIESFRVTESEILTRISLLQSEVDAGLRYPDDPTLRKLQQRLEHIEYMIDTNSEWLEDAGF